VDFDEWPQCYKCTEFHAFTLMCTIISSYFCNNTATLPFHLVCNTIQYCIVLYSHSISFAGKASFLCDPLGTYFIYQVRLSPTEDTELLYGCLNDWWKKNKSSVITILQDWYNWSVFNWNSPFQRSTVRTHNNCLQEKSTVLCNKRVGNGFHAINGTDQHNWCPSADNKS